MIELENVNYRYPASQQPALADITLQIKAGEFVAVVGANGAGKSTLLYALAGFVPHFYGGDFDGRLRVLGHDVAADGPASVVGQVGLVFQDPFNQISGARFTVREEIAFGLENLNVARAQMDERIDRALALAGLEGLGDRSPFALSGGQQQRLALASIVVMEPELLVLDEPTSQLDPVGTRQVFEALDRLTGERGTTIVIAEHKLEWVAAFADRVVVLDDGRIVEDAPPDQALVADETTRPGLGQTRYTRAGRLARQRGLIPADRPLPVTLSQAIEYFS
ncbi:MAG TPA: ABC transporter ATP-binding protein [Anaerolineales bacterium]|jgi:energy-coupling factor transporter ATP-binding protein EcfA2